MKKGLSMKEFILNILRGIVIGISNVIPGVSGGTMMVSMGIYDRLILVLTHFVKRFKEAVALLVPIGIGTVSYTHLTLPTIYSV